MLGGFSHTTCRPCPAHQLAVLQFSSALTLSLQQRQAPPVKASGPHGYSLHTRFRHQTQVQVVACASEQQLRFRAPRFPLGFGGYARAARRTQSSILLSASLVMVAGQGSGIARWRTHRKHGERAGASSISLIHHHVFTSADVLQIPAFGLAWRLHHREWTDQSPGLWP